MAASMPLSFNSQVPVTPPPDHQMFMKGVPPQLSKPFAQTTHPTTAKPEEKPDTPPSSSVSSHLPQQPQQPQFQPQPQTYHHHLFPQPPPHHQQPHHSPLDLQPTTSIPFSSSTPSPSSSSSTQPTASGGAPNQTDPATAAAAAAIDPRYIAMASRIAAYYQQRCQAVAAYQQQRCQQWAHAQRQKYQEMTDAAMLIVAWYIRDRIQRRRRRQKRTFKKRLAQKNNAPSLDPHQKITKGEGVRRWVMGVPLGAGAASPSSASRELPRDVAERDFDLDRVMLDESTTGNGGPAKKDDNALFDVADNLIKSRLARIDVPLLGALNFDESESESESSSDEENEEFEEEEEEEEEGGEEEEEDYEEYDEEFENYEEYGDARGRREEGKQVLREDEDGGKRKIKKEKEERKQERDTASLSKNAQLGTTTGTTRNPDGSSIS